MFSLGVVGLGAAVAGAGLAVGVSEAVAAFVVGTAFGRTHHAARIERLLAPVRDLFAAVFFLAIGLATDPRLLTATAGIVAVATVVTVSGQLVSGSLAGLAYGLDRRRAVRVGCALAPRGSSRWSSRRSSPRPARPRRSGRRSPRSPSATSS
ncbi:cation:proton antiporter [Halobaculum litoreum]|uniref:Cation:proton antiporter n=1 Tax=Halobaculum litoreum TaxID=3031998 RepID=A0ABD5XVG3_9EURY